MLLRVCYKLCSSRKSGSGTNAISMSNTINGNLLLVNVLTLFYELISPDLEMCRIIVTHELDETFRLFSSPF